MSEYTLRLQEIFDLPAGDEEWKDFFSQLYEDEGKGDGDAQQNSEIEIREIALETRD